MKNLILLLAFLEVSSFITARPTTFQCGGKPADIIFIIDTSSSIWRPDFDNHVIPFVKNVVQMFDIGQAANQTRVGVVTFADEYVHQFHLNEHMNKESLAKAIDDISFSGGNTNTFKAIKYMTDDMFTKENGARDNVAQIAIILTDGGSDDPEATRMEAERAREAGFTIFAIGVGYRVDFNELHDLASNPDTQTLFFVADFRALDSIKRILAIRTCEVKIRTTTTPKPTTTTTTPKPTTTTTTPAPTTTTTTQTTTTTTIPTTTTEIPFHDQPIEICSRIPADVYFILDSSSSVYILDFNNKMLPFVRNIVKSFNIGPNETRVSLITFSDQLNPVFGFDDFASKDALLKAIYPETVKYISGSTYTHEAIKYVREKGFKNARKDVPRIMIVITDGVSYQPRLTSAEAKAAQDSGISVFAIGVGPSVDLQELKNIASDPDDSFMFSVTDFDALDTIKDLISKETCNARVSGKDEVSLTECKLPPTDLMFIFESASRSVSERQAIHTIISSVAEQIDSLPKIQSTIRVGTLTDPCPATNAIAFTDLQSFRSKIASAVRRTNVRIDELLRQLRREKISKEDAERKRVAVLVVDENTRDVSRLLKEAARAMYKGIEIYVVAVGQVKEDVLQDLASSSTRHIIRVNSYDELKPEEFNLLNRMCSATKPMGRLLPLNTQ